MLDLKLRRYLTIWGLFQLAVLLALAAGVYGVTHGLLVARWNDDDYSYCYLLPAVIAYIVWAKRDLLRGLRADGGWWALLPMAVGALLYALGEFGSEYYSQFLSSWFVLLGLCWLFFGRAVLAELGFVFLLLFTMMPLPNFLNNRLAVQLQLIATHMGEALIRLMGMSVYREGNIIDLGFMQLQVVEACSGLRYLFPLIVLGLVMAYFVKIRLWKKCLLVVMTVPISLVLNALRIALTALASQHLGVEAAKGFSHDFAGWVVFLLSYVLLYLFNLGLARLPGEPDPKAEAAVPVDEAPGAPEPGQPEAEQAAPPRSLTMGRAPGRRFVVSALVLLGMFLGLTGQGGQELPPPIRSFAEFPMQIGPWTGRPQYLEKAIVDELRFSQYIMADYQAAPQEGPSAPVNLYVAYYQSQRKGQAIHSPESCLPGTGWSVEESGVVSVAGANGPQRLNRSLAAKQNSRILTYFWFQQQGRQLTSLPELKLSTFYGAITRRRSDGALVRLSTNLGQHERPEQADVRLQRFLRDVEPSLRAFVPD